MSYILDALRKSEQERVRGQALASLTQAAPLPANSRRHVLMGALLISNLLLLGAAFWWVQHQPSGTSIATPSGNATDSVASVPTSASPTTQSAPQQTTVETELSTSVPLRATPLPAATRPPSLEANPSPAVFNNANRRVPVRVAPDEIRIAPERTAAVPTRAKLVPGAIPVNFPRLRLSTHIYSSDASFRTVVINGMRLHEGDQLGNGVRVVAITEDGAHVEYQGEEALLKME